MKRTSGILVVFLLTLAVAGFVWAYGEGPSDSGRWVYGQVVYSDGSKCAKCCSVSIETNTAFSKDGCTDDNGNYKIYIASEYVKRVYFKGAKVWDGTKEAKGGANIDIRIK